MTTPATLARAIKKKFDGHLDINLTCSDDGRLALLVAHGEGHYRTMKNIRAKYKNVLDITVIGWEDGPNTLVRLRSKEGS